MGTELLACARQHRDAPLATLEQAVLERVRAAQGGLLETVVERSTTSLAPQQGRMRLACPTCGERAGVQAWRERWVRTVLGRIRFERPWYVCAACEHGWSPADATLELEPLARLSAARLGAADLLDYFKNHAHRAYRQLDHARRDLVTATSRR